MSVRGHHPDRRPRSKTESGGSLGREGDGREHGLVTELGEEDAVPTARIVEPVARVGLVRFGLTEGVATEGPAREDEEGDAGKDAD